MGSRNATRIMGTVGPAGFQVALSGITAFFKSWKNAAGEKPTLNGDPRINETVFTGDDADDARVTLSGGKEKGHTFLSCVWGVQTTGDAGAVTLREGANAANDEYTSSTDPTRVFDHEIEGAAPGIRYAGATWNGRRPDTGQSAIWSICNGNETANANALYGVTLLCFPISARAAEVSEISADVIFTGPQLGYEKHEVHNQTGGTHEYDDATAADEDRILTPTDATWNVSHGDEDFICFFRAQPRSNLDAAARRLRWSFWMDGEEVFNVRTNNTTAGATANGRGFNARYALDNFAGVYTMPFLVKRLSSGNHSWYTLCNRFQITDSNEQLRNVGLLMFRTRCLQNFTYMEYAQAIVSSSDSWSDSPFTITVTSDGAPVVLMFSTTSHHAGAGGNQWCIKRNGVDITPKSDVVGVPFGVGPGMQNFSDGGPGVGDTDNETWPTTLLWVDSSPAVGSNVYVVQYRREPTLAQSAMWNCRDDGSSGFKGTFAGFVTNLPTAGLG